MDKTSNKGQAKRKALNDSQLRASLIVSPLPTYVSIMSTSTKSKAHKAILSWAVLLLISQIQVLAATQAEIKELTTGWSVNAKSKGSTRDSAETMKMRTWQTNSTTLSSSMEGSIRLSQSARAPRQVSLLILWIGFDIGTKKQSLIKEDTQEIGVPPGVEKTFEFNSGEITFKKVVLRGF